MRLTQSIRIKGSKPLVPLFHRCFCFLEITNDWEFQRGEKAIVDDFVVFPTIRCARDIIRGFGLQPSALVQIKVWTFNVVKLKSILLKDTTDTTCLDPEKSGKEQMETATGNSNERGARLGVCCVCSVVCQERE